MPTAQEALAELARREISRRKAQGRFIEFCARMDDDYDASLPHAKIICEHLEALHRREIENLAIFMPPQHGKSYHFSQRFPAYVLGSSAGKALVATTSYTIDIARKNSRAARALVDDQRYPFDIQMASDARAVDEWYTTAGGGVKAAGVGGSLTGFGANLIIVDDPFKGMAEANSAHQRDEVWEWWQTTVSTRQRADTSKLLAQTRWHQDDLAGRILNTKAGKTWTVLRLCSFAEEDDPLGRAPGELLWPGGPPPLNPDDGEISIRGFAALYQQRPMPAEGLIFKSSWFEHVYYNAPEATRTVVAVDGAWKEGVTNDRSAIALWGTNKQQHWPIEVIAKRWEYPDLRSNLVGFCERHKPGKVIIEDAASGTALIADLKRETHLPVIGVKPIHSKIARVEAVTPYFESGRVLVPYEAQWKADWLAEHLDFPGGAHDDMVDTTAMALSDLAVRKFYGAIAV